MNDLVRSTIEKFHMIQKGDNVMACVSGGADSMALLSFLLHAQEELGIATLYACHFNHGLRGKHSDKDEALVRDYCDKNGVRLVCGYGNMPQTPLPKGESIESFARKLRYDFFELSAKTNPGTKIAVAHNKNDQAETILFHLTRGTGIRGARGMPPVRGNIIRPLIAVSRQEIEYYCKDNGIPYAHDATNADVMYARNRIRHNVIPQLEQVNAAAVDRIVSFGEQAAVVSDYIEGIARENLAAARTAEGYDIKCLLKDGDIVANYSMKLLIEDNGVCPDEKGIALCMDVLHKRASGVQLGACCVLVRARDTVNLCETTAVNVPVYCEPVTPGITEFLGKYRIKTEVIDDSRIHVFKKSSKNILNNSIDYDKIIGNVVLRNKREGDAFRSCARGNTKKIKKILQEKGMHPAHRPYIPLLSDDGGVVWLMGEGVCDRVAVTADTTRILWIEVSQMEA